MHAIWTEGHDTSQDMAHRMIQSVQPVMIRRWSESTLANWKQLVLIPNKNEKSVNLQWTKDEQAKLQTVVERYTLLGASGA
jgi:hypothetical protein